MVRGLWSRLILFAVGIYVSDLGIRTGLIALLLLDLAILTAVVALWRAGKLTLGTAGVAISLGVFQVAIWARGDQEPFANGLLLGLSFALFLAALFVGSRQLRQGSSTDLQR